MDKDTIVPFASEEEKRAVESALETLRFQQFAGARRHLLLAAQALSGGDFASSVRESIHSVESVARTIAGTGKLSDALAGLEKKKIIHEALKRGFISIYGYTSDERGVRHPLIEKGSAAVDESDAIFMIGACAAFVTYLVRKSN